MPTFDSVAERVVGSKPCGKNLKHCSQFDSFKTATLLFSATEKKKKNSKSVRKGLRHNDGNSLSFKILIVIFNDHLSYSRMSSDV